MSSDDHVFLFSSLQSRKPLTARKVHLRRLYDILQLSIHRQDFQRAKQVWIILARCKEVDWKALWSTGLFIIGETDDGESAPRNSVDYLHAMMLQCPEDRETILKELVFRLLLENRCRDALDELELYLPSLPYQDNPTLHIYAALCSLYLAQRDSGEYDTITRHLIFSTANLPGQHHRYDYDRNLLRDAQSHLEHAKALNVESTFAEEFINKIRNLQNQEHITTQAQDSDDESMVMEESAPDRKRIRT
ncbi:hypothetical protein CPC08DRAFT_653909 [Agrocybe pediades]|nr:hypothetical protein CPC08DRAFT_653909 [Agrocybe pediades]